MFEKSYLPSGDDQDNSGYWCQVFNKSVKVMAFDNGYYPFQCIWQVGRVWDSAITK